MKAVVSSQGRVVMVNTLRKTNPLQAGPATDTVRHRHMADNKNTRLITELWERQRNMESSRNMPSFSLCPKGMQGGTSGHVSLS